MKNNPLAQMCGDPATHKPHDHINKDRHVRRCFGGPFTDTQKEILAKRNH